MFSFIRCYFLYIYYWFTIKHAKQHGEEGSRSAGFGGPVLIFILLGVVPFMWFGRFYPNESDEFYVYFLEIGGRLKTHKGYVNVAMLSVHLIIAILFSYLLCCYKIKFSSIPERLEQYSFLRQFSWWKLCLPYVFLLTLFMLSSY